MTKRVQKTTNNRGILPEYESSEGYKMVHLQRNDGKWVYEYVHKLVAETFVPNPNNYTIINHKDGNKHNNEATNLEWVSKY